MAVRRLLELYKEQWYNPPDIAMFEKLCSSITGAQMRYNAFLQRVQAYFIMQRRNLYLFHAPSSLTDDQKTKLLLSPIFDQVLFDQTTLDSVISEHQGDVSNLTNQKLAKAITSVLPT